MSEIPTISITQTETDDVNESNDLNINDVHTDIESIDSDCENSSAKIRFLKSCPTAQPIPTDTEDFNGSGSDDEIIEQPEAEFSLNDFLDQGFVEEAANISDRLRNCKIDGAKMKVSKSNLCIDDSANKIILTDCENDDGERSEYAYSDVSINLLPDQNNIMKINDSVKRFNKKMTIKDTNSTSSESETESKPVNKHHHHHHSHHHHHQKKSNTKFDHSDVENIIFSDDDDQSSKPNRNRKSKITFLTEPEEMIMLISDNEEACCSEQVRKIPEINITFGSNKKCLKKKSLQKTSLSLPVKTDDVLTDVENLNSSEDDDDDNQCKTNLSIPAAVFKTGNLTDVEDFDDDIDDDDEIVHDDFMLPSPTRQMVILSENDNVSKVLPLSNSSFLLVQPVDDSGLTDNEDLSDYEDDDLSSGKGYEIEQIPDYILDSGISVVNNNDKVLNDESPTAIEPERKKRTKSKISHKHKKLLSVGKPQAVITTDVEELSDDDRSSKKSLKKSEIQLPITDDGGKTDVEYFSEDEAFINYYTPEIDNDAISGNTYFSLVHLKDGENSKERENKNNFNLPVIRKIVATPIQLTDSEALSDDDGALNEYRSDMVTPSDLCDALNESGCSTVHDVDTRVFDVNQEKAFIKGFKDINEVHTDSEVLVEDEQ